LRCIAVPLVVFVSCANPRMGSVVAAPSNPASPGKGGSLSTVSAATHDKPAACARPWKLEAAGGDSRVVVVCTNDVRRESLEDSGEMARALFPALDPAQQRICACTEAMQTPPFIDLIFTAKPDEGRVTVQATADDDLDPELGPAFIACIGTVAVNFAPETAVNACPSGKASFLYPVRLELGP
jgi:hypothetical protein